MRAIEPAAARHESVVLEVSDEGVGIPADELDAIFQPFRGSFAKGTGLGLAIVHRIVSDYEGEIQVSSTPGRGTTVQSCVCRSKRSRQHERTKNSEHAKRIRRAFERRTRQSANRGTRNRRNCSRRAARLLVVDDERSMRELLSIVLRREGYDVTLAENGRIGDGAARSSVASIS